VKYLVAFGAFWYDFIVGDSIVLAIGGVGVLVLGYFGARLMTEELPQFLVPAAVVLTLVASIPGLLRLPGRGR
jgi:hypothetical protein